jgi:hypothetical protein
MIESLDRIAKQSVQLNGFSGLSVSVFCVFILFGLVSVLPAFRRRTIYTIPIRLAMATTKSIYFRAMPARRLILDDAPAAASVGEPLPVFTV